MLDLPQPSAKYDPARERVRNSRIKADLDHKVNRDEIFVGSYAGIVPKSDGSVDTYLKIDGTWGDPLAGGTSVDWADITSKPTTVAGYNITDFFTLGDAEWAQLVHGHAQADITGLVADLAAKAPIASPTFTGDPKSVTPAPGDNDTSIATSAFVKAAIDAALATIGSVPPATLAVTALTAAPTGWLLCFGQAVSRATYADLFAALNADGLIYGVGDGTTTFDLPDLRGRVVAGQDDMGGTSANRLTSPLNGDTLGATGGAESHTLTTPEMPAHTHPLSQVVGISAAGAGFTEVATNTNRAATVSDSTGGGGAHNNVQPTFIGNWMIKT